MKQTLLSSFMDRQSKCKEQTNQSERKVDHQNSVISEQKQSQIKVDDDRKIIKKANKRTLDSDEQSAQRSKQKSISVEKSSQDQQQNIKQNKTPKNSKKQRQSELAPKSVKTQQKINPTSDNDLDQFTDATPIWAQKQYCKDSNKRSPDDPNYDPTTLYVPDEVWNKLTAPMRQFWKIKSQNFDKIIFFKLGKFYELFYDDAVVGNKYLDLKFMGTKMHAGVPEKCLDKYAGELVELGFKIVVVEQMQKPDQMAQRIQKQKKEGRKSQKTLNREVTQIFTKGTYNVQDKENSETYLPNYLLSLRIFNQIYAFSLLEINTNEILMDTVDSLEKFKTVLFQTRPVQVVYDPDNVSFQLARMLQKTFLNMQMSKIINKNNIWHPLNSIGEIDRLEKQGKINQTKIFQVLQTLPETNRNLLHSTLAGIFQYLKKVFKFEYVINTVRFAFYQKDTHTKNMILDSQALQHLQIFQNSQGVEGSLFKTIDRTKTKFGKRLLRKWTMSPLMNTYHIQQRLNAIEDIERLVIQKQKVVSTLKKLPDLQKKLNKLYHYAVKTTNASKAVYFQDVNTNRLKQYKDLIQKMEEAWDAIQYLTKSTKKFNSTRLKQLVTVGNSVKINQQQIYAEDEDDQSNFGGLLPDIISNLNQFKVYIKWEGSIPVPQKGLVPSYDLLQDEEQRVKQELQKYLQKIRYSMNQPNLKFVDIKQRYEIQIPEKAQKRKPKDFQFSSKRAGFSRYVCPEVKKLVKQLQKTEQQIKKQMGAFIGFFFEEFRKKQKIWQRFIQIIAEIDCLFSLSEYSFLNQKVRPTFTQGKFQIKNAKHPCLTNIQFIPNDISMKNKVMILTGPNMGGKSTILRTVCCLAILAQIGCYVPAEMYDCETIDRIFTRIGASDQLSLGKSTFFIQMEQTKSVLEYATSRSLAIMDQLGRGTSTFDGLAIAYSVLKNIVEKINCYCLFATHYHILIDEFQHKNTVSFMKMDSILKDEQILFLYKLVPGHVEKSFGLNVASLVGISKETLQIAEKEADKMNEYIEGRRRAVLRIVQEFLQQQ